MHKGLLTFFFFLSHLHRSMMNNLFTNIEKEKKTLNNILDYLLKKSRLLLTDIQKQGYLVISIELM